MRFWCFECQQWRSELVLNRKSISKWKVSLNFMCFWPWTFPLRGSKRIKSSRCKRWIHTWCLILCMCEGGSAGDRAGIKCAPKGLKNITGTAAKALTSIGAHHDAANASMIEYWVERVGGRGHDSKRVDARSELFLRRSWQWRSERSRFRQIQLHHVIALLIRPFSFNWQKHRKHGHFNIFDTKPFVQGFSKFSARTWAGWRNMLYKMSETSSWICNVCKI